MLRVGLVGLGWWGRTILAQVQGKSQRLAFVKGASPVAAEREAVTASHGLPCVEDWRAFLNDPEIDALAFVTPPNGHREQIEAAAAAGKPVMVEKPLALSRPEAEAAVAACRAAGIVLAVGFNRRFYTPMQRLAELVRSGTLGTVFLVEQNFSHSAIHNYDPKGWRVTDPTNNPHGLLGFVGNGIHALDGVIRLGGRPRSVFARTKHIELPLPGNDLTTVSIDFDGGPLGQIGTILGTPLTWVARAYGSKARAEVRSMTTIEITWQDGRSVVETYPEANIELAEYDAFAAAVAGEAAYPVSLDEALWGVAAFEAVIQSVATGAPVAIA